MAVKGADYSWDRPDLDCLWNQGVRFICRYGSRDPSKNLTKAELDAALARGMSVVVIWQEGKTQMLRGYAGGQADARDADAFVNGLGLRGTPVIFACDQDFEACSSADKSSVDAYCDGVVSVIGLGRAGGYGDDSFCKRQFDAGRITFGMQTYAWSEGMWEPRAQLRQVNNNQSVCGGYIDWDEARADDFGQWPRPAAPLPPETVQPAPAMAGINAPASVIVNGKLHTAAVWNDGRPHYQFENSGWYPIDPADMFRARSSADICANYATGLLVVTVTGTDGNVCTWQQRPPAPDGAAVRGQWGKYNRGGWNSVR